MGMFDYIVCDYPLPDGFDANGFEFQTKDTKSQYMDTYIITAEGRLMYEAWDRTWHEPTADRKYGHAERTNRRLEDENHHGDIEFYGSTMSGGGPGYYTTQDDKPLVERGYIARFTNGQLQSITVESTNEGEPDKDMRGRKHISRADWSKGVEAEALT